MATPDDVSHLMLIMSAVYPSYTLETQTIEIYTRLLADIPIDALDAAAKDIMTTSNFFPSVAEWRRAALALVFGLDQIPNEYEAWSEVVDRCNDWHPEYSDPLTSEVAALFERRDIADPEKREYIRAAFIKAYCALRDRQIRDACRLPDVTRTAETMLEAGQKRLSEVKV